MVSSSTTPIYCVNHPNTETLLRCYRCGKPVCVKCVTRTPVGLICKECLSNQQSGYFTASPIDYVLTAIVGFILSLIGGIIATLLGGLWIIAIFYGPFAGGIIAEGIRFVIRRRRGRYIGLVACAMVLIGALIPIAPTLLLILFSGSTRFLFSALLNIGLWIYVVLALGTVYARLR